LKTIPRTLSLPTESLVSPQILSHLSRYESQGLPITKVVELSGAIWTNNQGELIEKPPLVAKERCCLIVETGKEASMKKEIDSEYGQPT
jgi:hypothetical protein